MKTILIIFVALILPPRYVSGQTTNRIPFNLVYAEKFHAKFIQWASLGSKFDDFPGIFSVSIYTDTLSIDSLYVDSVMLVLAKQVLPHGSAYKKEDIASVTVIPKSKS
ncbi:MAG TPA: hypothetical protein VD905_02715 [Flavobacteriales bacterium]|nr:hypothetical protein [Flavobacteriales bacterium]